MKKKDVTRNTDQRFVTKKLGCPCSVNCHTQRIQVRDPVKEGRESTQTTEHQQGVASLSQLCKEATELAAKIGYPDFVPNIMVLLLARAT